MHEPIRIVPHPRTLRKAREQVKYMVIDEVSPFRIRNYLHRWVTWWVKTSDSWQFQEVLQWFLEACWLSHVSIIAHDVFQRHFKKLNDRRAAHRAA